MKKKLKLLLLLIITFVIYSVVLSNISYKEDKYTKVKEEIIETEEDKEIESNEIEVVMAIEEETKEEETEAKAEIETVELTPDMINLGEFKLTAYCKCEVCCGKWTNHPTASGVMPTENHTIAVDTNVIPFGTKVMIDGIVYVAEDTGSAIKGNRIDIYMPDHKSALEFGVRHKNVFKVK
jgi:3D (Asp-Asp-Asp) domain-containing protein